MRSATKSYIRNILSITIFLIASQGLGDPTIPIYSRGNFEIWADFDQDCLNTRHELLSEQSEIPVIYSENGCRVIVGQWFDPYTGRVFTNPSDVDVDHIVPLSWAWQHGAWLWSDQMRIKFGNDPLNLLIVDDATNMSKGASGPLDWLPPMTSYHCTYIERFLIILDLYELSLTPRESEAIHIQLENLCS